VRSDHAIFGWPAWLRWVLGGVLVAVLGVVGCCGLGLWRLSTAFQDAQKGALKEMERAQAAAEAERQARTVVVAAADLLTEFANNPAADRKYAGMYLQISGVVERVGRGRHDAPFVILTGGDENAKLKIECFFDAADKKAEAEIMRLDKGQSITVRGEYDGQVSNIQARDCILVKPLPVGKG
jgi:hypothetical protein